MTIESPNFIIHDIRVDPPSILVGATDTARWGWEMQDAGSGANATTLVWVELTQANPGGYTVETMGLFCVERTEPLRPRALATLPALFEAAWQIKDAGWGQREACDHLRGRPIALPPYEPTG